MILVESVWPISQRAQAPYPASLKRYLHLRDYRASRPHEQRVDRRRIQSRDCPWFWTPPPRLYGRVLLLLHLLGSSRYWRYSRNSTVEGLPGPQTHKELYARDSWPHDRSHRAHGILFLPYFPDVTTGWRFARRLRQFRQDRFVPMQTSLLVCHDLQ